MCVCVGQNRCAPGDEFPVILCNRLNYNAVRNLLAGLADIIPCMKFGLI